MKLFPFGFGLSYTTFEYSDIAVAKDADRYVLTFNVKNTGKVAGAEVSQVYIGDDESSLVRPEMELKGFEKVFLKPGESKTVSITLDSKAFRFYDPYIHDFVVEPGTFTAYVGASCDDIRLRLSFEVE